MKIMDTAPVVIGNCVICGKKVEVAKWIAEKVRPSTCSRECGEKEAKELGRVHDQAN